MHRTTKSKRSTAQPRAKKQSSILSFFASTPQSAPNPSTPPVTPASEQPAPRTPNTSLSLSLSRPSTRRSSPHSRPKPAAAALRRELFRDADDEPILPPSKRLCIERKDDDVPLARISSLSRHARAKRPEPPRCEPVVSIEKDSDQEMSEWNVHDQSAVEEHGVQQNTVAQNVCPEPVIPNQQCESPKTSFSFDFGSLSRQNATSGASQTVLAPATPARSLARKKLAELDHNSHVIGNEQGWCEKHSWSINIRDAQKRPPQHPDYDNSTLYVPASELAENRGTKQGGLSPFQRQFWTIKKANYDVIIFFKKGKFYELYDVDADVGHKVLNLNFTKGGRVDMRCCGVPEQAFDKHCARLIDAGYKVGRVEQTETANAAEKRKNGSGSNKATVCERSLVRILTKATVADEGLLRDHRARYVLAITENAQPTNMTDSELSTSVEDDCASDNATKTLGVCYVDVASGSINISQYQDDFRLSRTERLITFLRPQELIVDLSESGPRLTNIVTWSSRKSGADVCDLGKKNGFQPMTESWLAKYLRNSSSSETNKVEFENVCTHMKRYSLSCRAFGAVASYLKTLIIDSETLSLGNYILYPEVNRSKHSFSAEDADSSSLIPSTSRLRMDAPTLQNLEVLATSLSGSEKGSLLSFVDQAHTAAGRRLIRKWIAEPLLCSEEIEDRLQVVEDIHNVEDEDGGRNLTSVIKLLKTKKDLERALPKLHRQATVDDAAVMFDDTNKRRVRDFVSVLRSLQNNLAALETLAELMESSRPKSKRLKWLCSIGCAVPNDALDKLSYFLGDAFDLEKAEGVGEIVPKKGAIPSYDIARSNLTSIEDELKRELKKWQDRLGDKTMKFYHRGKEPYQIEVKLDTIRGRTPNEFEVVSESKTAKRFYTRRVKSLVHERIEALEAFESASSSVARDMMQQFDKEYSTWSCIITACAEVDALIGLAQASREAGSGPMCRPKVIPNSHPLPLLRAEGLRHPILAANSESFVSNDVTLGGGKDAEIMILTGPNAGGKSTLARQTALSVILAQAGCYVPAESFSFRPFEDIFVRMGASDDLARGRSTFMVEMEEVGNILNNANSRSLIIADEVGRGTSTHDGYAVAYASLDHIARVNKSLTVFSTHYSHLGEDIVALGKKEGRLSAALYEMAAIVDENSKKITFLYKVQLGASGKSRGIYCARVAGIPGCIAEDAEKAAMNFDESLGHKLEGTKFVNFCKVLQKGGGAGNILQQVV